MAIGNVSVVLVHGAWADGSSWSKVIERLKEHGINAVAAPLAADLVERRRGGAGQDARADRRSGCGGGPRLCGAVIGATRAENVKALVYVAALAPDEGETVGEVFYRGEAHPQAPKLAPDEHGLIWLPQEAFAAAIAQDATPQELTVLAAVQRPISVVVHRRSGRASAVEGPSKLVPDRRAGPDDQRRHPAFHGASDECPRAIVPGRSHTDDHVARRRDPGDRRSSQRFPLANDPQVARPAMPTSTAPIRLPCKETVMSSIAYRHADVDGLKVFYREAGASSAPKLLLLHGFPSSSHMFRDLIPKLADRFHIVAPDLPGFGQSDMPARDGFAYTFENIAKVIGRFTEVVGFDRFAMYVFDYGAPTGFRLALSHPERITAIISQNGNAYEEGLSDGWNPIRAYWQDASPRIAKHFAQC